MFLNEYLGIHRVYFYFLNLEDQTIFNLQTNQSNDQGLNHVEVKLIF